MPTQATTSLWRTTQHNALALKDPLLYERMSWPAFFQDPTFLSAVGSVVAILVAKLFESYLQRRRQAQEASDSRLDHVQQLWSSGIDEKNQLRERMNEMHERIANLEDERNKWRDRFWDLREKNFAERQAHLDRLRKLTNRPRGES